MTSENQGSRSLGISEHAALSWPEEAQGTRALGQATLLALAAVGRAGRVLWGRLSGVSSDSPACYLGHPGKLTGFSQAGSLMCRAGT